ncbi:MAG: hypothetical protein HYV07_19010 [Deltaproteobacteria bacterium]|nr:hypothetical protein [Deltaproteobacteria bacterium]
MILGVLLSVLASAERPDYSDEIPFLVVEPVPTREVSGFDELRVRAFAARFTSAVTRAAASSGVVAVKRSSCGTEWVCSASVGVVRAELDVGRDSCHARAWRAASSEPRELDIPGCKSSELLHVAEILGGWVSGGRKPRPPDLSFTRDDVPAEDVVFLPEVFEPSAHVGTSLADAIEGFASERLVIVPAPPIFAVQRAGEVLDDCRLLELAGRQPSEGLSRRCRGNDFELAYSLVPLGLGAAAVGAIEHDTDAGPLLVLGGISVALVGAIVGLVLNEDGPAKGAHIVDLVEVRALVDEVNQRIARSLGLGEADLEVAGMSRTRP